MSNSFYNKDEKKFVSKKNLKKIKKENFLDYISYYDNQLTSLKKSYDPINDKNLIIEDLIAEMQIFVDDLNAYYYETYLVKNNPPIPGKDFETFTLEMDQEISKTINPIDKEISKKIREIAKLELKNRF